MGRRRPDQPEEQKRVTGVDDTACFLQAVADVRPLPAPPPPPRPSLLTISHPTKQAKTSYDVFLR